MEQSDLLRLAIATLERLKIVYAVVGSMASSAWGESRFTQDIDIVIQVDQRSVGLLCDAFAGDEFYVSRTAAIESVQQSGQFNVLNPESGNKIDFMIAGGSKWESAQLARRKRIAVTKDCVGFVAAPEDVILGKLIYYNEGGSEKHLRDITGILSISGDQLDHEYLDSWIEELGLADGWRKILARCDEQTQ
ncbi:MAG: hypothetical protein WD851_11220 [Pirellulales bacterium]